MKRRLSTVKIVEKLTRAMKMVAVVRMQRYEKAFDIAKVFTEGMSGFYGEDEKKAESGDDLTLVTLSTDRGLCGSVNSQCKRLIDARLRELKAEKINYDIIALGTKNRANLEKENPGKLKLCVNGVLGQTYAFETALQLGEHILRTDPSFINVIGNKFTSLFNVGPHRIDLRGYKQVQQTEYDDFAQFLGNTKSVGFSDVYQNFNDFRNACVLYTSIKESDLCEQASRMMAMETASTNAEDMRKSLTLAINRRRQAKVTTDLLEIIAGVVGVEAILKEDAERVAMEKKK